MRIFFLVAALFFPTLGASGAPTEGSLRLTGVMISQSGSSAMISGRFVRPGDRIDQAEVLSIDASSVVIAEEGKQYVLRIGSGVQRIQSGAITPAVSVAPKSPSAPHIYYSSVQRRATSTADARYHEVAPGETLSGIAADYFGWGDARINQAMQMLYQDHPSAFGGSMNVVFEGSRLRIPNRNELLRIDSSAAAIEVARHVEGWNVKQAVDQPIPSVELMTVPAEEFYGPVETGETLSLIAERIRPSNVSLNQMMLAVYEANPESFGGNINVLYEGVSLRIPASQAFLSRAEELATEQVEQHREEWRAQAADRDVSIEWIASRTAD